MDNFEQFIPPTLIVIVGGIAIMSWIKHALDSAFSRLDKVERHEMQLAAIDQRLHTLEASYDAKLSQMLIELSQIRERLVRIETRLDHGDK